MGLVCLDSISIMKCLIQTTRALLSDCTVCSLKVLSIVWIHSIKADAPVVDIARAILLFEKRDDPGLMCASLHCPFV